MAEIKGAEPNRVGTNSDETNRAETNVAVTFGAETLGLKSLEVEAMEVEILEIPISVFLISISKYVFCAFISFVLFSIYFDAFPALILEITCIFRKNVSH